MFTRTVTRPTLLATLLAGFAFAAMAQAQAPAKTQGKAPAAELSAKDKAVVETSFGRADANGDGKLSKEEAVKLPAVSTKFEELDKNKDGFLSLDEFAAGVASPS
jgi:hypothetical protein